MQCIDCDTDANAICRFCGRAVCKRHLKTKPYCSGYSAAGVKFVWTRQETAIRVADAVWCGVCEVEYPPAS